MGRLYQFLGCLFLTLAFASGVRAESVPPVVMFSIDHCPSCLAAKEYLTKEEVPFAEYNIDQSPKAKDVFKRLGGRGAPFFLIEGKRYHGFDPDRFDRLVEHLKVTR